MAGRLRSRLAKPSDAQLVAHWLEQGFAGPVQRVDGLAPTIARLLAAESVRILAVEALSAASETWDLYACGISAFVAPRVFQAELDAPRPFLLMRLLTAAAADASMILDLEAVARANAGEGLDVYVEYMQAGWSMTDPLWRQVAAIGNVEYTRHHRGYRLRRALQEGWAAQDQIYRDAGYRVHRRFEPDVLAATRAAGAAPPAAHSGDVRILYYTDLDEIKSRSPGLAVTHAFEFAEPRCGFSRGEQRVLARAIEGLTDQEIAGDLGTTSNAVKQTWRSIYERISDRVPGILGTASSLEAGKRGPEKRRRVIAYVESHLEELRPYAREPSLLPRRR